MLQPPLPAACSASGRSTSVSSWIARSCSWRTWCGTWLHGDAVRPGDKNAKSLRDAAIEVRKPTLFGELIILIVYLPILTLEGVEGKLFRPMALTVVFALLGSLLFSLTLSPVLCSLFLPKKLQERDPWIIRLCRWLYRPLLQIALAQRFAVLGLAVASLVAAVIVFRSLGSDFLPVLSEGEIRRQRAAAAAPTSTRPFA